MMSNRIKHTLLIIAFVCSVVLATWSYLQARRAAEEFGTALRELIVEACR